MENDKYVKARKILERRHIFIGRKIKTLSSKGILDPRTNTKEEIIKAIGEKEGLCYAFKVLDRACQTEMPV